MAQANVAREPSMEEILASIRKIIESNDAPDDLTDEGGTTSLTASNDEILSGAARLRLSETNRSYVDAASRNVDDRDQEEPLSIASAALAQQPSGVELPVGRARLETSDAIRSEVLSGQNEKSETGMAKELAKLGSLTPPPRMTPRFDAHSEAPAKSLAQIAAEQQAAPDSEEVRSSHDVEEPVEPDSTVVLTVNKDPESDAQEHDMVKTDSVGVVENVSKSVEACEKTSAVMDEPDLEGETVSTEDRQPLISVAAGAKVAASFGNLNQAVNNSPVRSFDEIAEEMLRPMLQHWLDDNLPTMVERLVREEIERVARGS